MWRIISDGVLSTPLLKKENDEGDDKADEVAFSEECFLKTKAFAGSPLFGDLRFDFGVFLSNSFRMDVISA